MLGFAAIDLQACVPELLWVDDHKTDVQVGGEECRTKAVVEAGSRVVHLRLRHVLQVCSSVPHVMISQRHGCTSNW